jgi:hypothetical protein
LSFSHSTVAAPFVSKKSCLLLPVSESSAGTFKHQADKPLDFRDLISVGFKEEFRGMH